MSIARSSYLKNTTGGDFVDQKQGGTILGQSADTDTTKSLTLKDSSKQSGESGIKEGSRVKRVINGRTFAQMSRDSFSIFGSQKRLAGIVEVLLQKLGGSSTGRSDTSVLPPIYSETSGYLEFINIDPNDEWDYIYVLDVNSDPRYAPNPRINMKLQGNLEYDLYVDWGDGSDVQRYQKTAGAYFQNYIPINKTGYILVKLREANEQAVQWLWAYSREQAVNFQGSPFAIEKGVLKFYKHKDTVLSSTGYSFYEWFSEKTPQFTGNTLTDFLTAFSEGNANDPILGQLDTSSVTAMRSCFKNNLKFNQNISSWDVSSVTNMQEMFAGATSFNQPLNDWDVSSVTNFTSMFETTQVPLNIRENVGDLNINIFNQPLNNWDVSNATNMNYMFRGSDFNNDVSGWSPAGSIYGIFTGQQYRLNKFNHPSISTWNTTAVTDMSYVFSGNPDFNQNINSWDVSNVTAFQGMFSGVSSFNQPLDQWDISSATNLNAMFANAISFNQDITGWNTSNVINMDMMFSGCTNFDQDISQWDFSSIYNIFFFLPNLNLGMANFFINGKLATDKYDLLLIKLASQAPSMGGGMPAGLDMGTSTYTAGSTGETARNTLVNTYGWTILDGGTA